MHANKYNDLQAHTTIDSRIVAEIASYMYKRGTQPRSLADVMRFGLELAAKVLKQNALIEQIELTEDALDIISKFVTQRTYYQVRGSRNRLKNIQEDNIYYEDVEATHHSTEAMPSREEVERMHQQLIISQQRNARIEAAKLEHQRRHALRREGIEIQLEEPAEVTLPQLSEEENAHRTHIHQATKHIFDTLKAQRDSLTDNDKRDAITEQIQEVFSLSKLALKDAASAAKLVAIAESIEATIP